MKKPPFNVVVADPPWQFGDKLPGPSRGAAKNYRVLTLPQIMGYLRTEKIEVAPDALLFLWRVSSQVEEANMVARDWGFKPKSEVVWVKLARRFAKADCPNEPIEWRTGEGLHFGMGRYVRASHETCIVAARGKAIPLVGSHSVRSVLLAPVGAHSAKPEAFYDLVEKLVPGGRYVELFARRKRKGWTCMGDEV